MSWYKKVITENKKEVVQGAIISLVITLGFSIWYFAAGKSFEWQSISPISQPGLLSREFYSAIAFVTIGAFLYYVLRLWQILKFICVDVLDSWKLYNFVKSIVWAILILITQFYLVPTVIDWLNTVISFFYNAWLLILYIAPPVGIFLIVLSATLFLRRKHSKYICGVEFFRLPDLASLDVEKYFRCLDALRPLFDDPDFKASVMRFYFNRITVPDDNLNSLRLVYDTAEPEKVQAIIKDFVQRNRDGIVICESSWTNRPDKNQSLGTAEGEDLSFRNFLHTNTQVFLEASHNYGHQPLRELIHKYRHDSLLKRIPPERVLGEAFNGGEYFSKLRVALLDTQYWNDLIHLFNGADPGIHFLVNMSAVDEWGYDPRFFQENWIIRK